MKSRLRTNMRNQIYRLLAVTIIPFLIMTFVLLFLISSFNQNYSAAMQNANIAAEFNNEFKNKLDSDMYYHVIGGKSEAQLPWEEVNHARQVFLRLQDTTMQDENLWRVRSMINLCDRLGECMINITHTESYDSRMQQLDTDIRIITALIESYMHDYIYDEIKELSSLQKQIAISVKTTILITAFVSVVLICLIAAYSLSFMHRITNPINQLRQKMLRLGDGDFTVEKIDAGSEEIEALDEGFNEMIGRMNTLLKMEKENQKTLRRTELELLQAQINPHFLYNTLDSIIWLAESERNSDVVKMVTNLSVFFRNSLSGGKDIISLEDERNQVKSYLKIQQIRYSDILEYDIDIPEDLLSCSIPKLTLQPLVENAIYHGIKNKRGIGHISIEGRQEKGKVLLTVHDSGVGMSEEQLQALSAGIYEDRHTGLGLVNVHKRIKLYCGEEYGLTFDRAKGGGTTVTVSIPKEENNQ